MGGTNWQERADALDLLIRAGRGEEVRARLARLARGAVPRAWLLPFASAARRAGLPELGVRWLARVVRPSRSAPASATPAERAEYAACLTRAGAVDEALRCLDAVDAAVAPEALLYRSFALVTRWEYAATVPLLERYVATPGLDEYARLVGEANLAAALVVERRSAEADALLASLRRRTARPELGFLEGKAIELQAQSAVGEGDWPRARACLREAQARLGAFGGIDGLFVHKWRAITELLADPRRLSAAAELAAVRNDAAARRHWETVRQCDRYRALALRDDALARNVLFGTPFESFRRAFLRDYGPELAVPETHERRFGDGVPAATLDLTAEARGDVVSRCLSALAADFYRPLRLASLHAALYPGEHFDPESSPERAHRVLRRLRAQLKEQSPGFSVTETDGDYRLEARGPAAIRVALRAPAETGVVVRLKRACAGRLFSSAEASSWLGLSKRATQYALKEAVEGGALEPVGTGAATRYRFVAALLLGLALALGGCARVDSSTPAKPSLSSVEGGNGEGISGDGLFVEVECKTAAGDLILDFREDGTVLVLLTSPRYVPPFKVTRTDGAARVYESPAYAFHLSIAGATGTLDATIDGTSRHLSLPCTIRR